MSTTYSVLTLAIILNALANILMKVAMRKQGTTTEVAEYAEKKTLVQIPKSKYPDIPIVNEVK